MSVILHPHYAVVFVCNYIFFLAYSIVNAYITGKVLTILCKGTIILSFATNCFKYCNARMVRLSGKWWHFE